LRRLWVDRLHWVLWSVLRLSGGVGVTTLGRLLLRAGRSWVHRELCWLLVFRLRRRGCVPWHPRVPFRLRRSVVWHRRRSGELSLCGGGLHRVLGNLWVCDRCSPREGSGVSRLGRRHGGQLMLIPKGILSWSHPTLWRRDSCPREGGRVARL